MMCCYVVYKSYTHVVCFIFDGTIHNDDVDVLKQN